MRRAACAFAVLALWFGAEAEGALNCRVRYVILNGFVVEQSVRIALPEGERDLAVWLVERGKGAFRELAYPIGGAGTLRITRPFSREKSVEHPFILTWRRFGGLHLTGFFLSGRRVHAVVVREEKGKRVIEMFPAFPGHISAGLARGECGG